MELEKFVQESLLQIMRGVTNAQKEVGSNSETRGVVGPRGARALEQLVEFDVAINIVESDKLGTSGGIQVWQVFKAGGDYEVQNESQQTTRIKFSIPLRFAGTVPGGPRASKDL